MRRGGSEQAQSTQGLRYFSPSTLAAAYVGVMAVAVQNVAPALAGVLHLSLGWSGREIGTYAAADALGIFVGGLLAAGAMTLGSFRALALAGMSVLGISDLLSGLSSSPALLIGERLIGGLGGGVALGISFSVFAASHPERDIAIWSVGQLAFSLVGISAMPVLAAALHWPGPLFTLAALTVPAIVLARYLPTTQRPLGTTSPVTQTRVGSIGVLGIMSVALFYFGQGSLWPHLEVLGLRSGITQKSVETSLSLSAVTALLGSIFVLVAGTRFGRKLPLLGAFALTLAALFSLDATQPQVFRIALAAFTFAWPVFGAYQFAIIARSSASTRIGALISAATFAGSSLGPVLAGIISDRAGFGEVLWLAAALDCVALACLLPLLRKAAWDGASCAADTIERT